MTRATFKKGAKVARIERKLADPSKALAQIGVLMVAESQRSFRDQKLGTTKWEPRAPVNVFGIIADFHDGRKKPPARRFERRPALRDTGRLASSIAHSVKGNVVEVGTTVRYAAVHLRGGEVESKPLTSAVRSALWKWLRNQSTELKRRLGWVLNRKFRDKTLKQEVPARPFLGITAETRRNVRKVVGVEIMEAK